MRRGFLRPKQKPPTKTSKDPNTSTSKYQVARLIRFDQISSRTQEFTPKLEYLPVNVSKLAPGYIFCRLPSNAISDASECLINTSLYTKLLAIPDFPKPVSSPPMQTYRICSTTDRGLGMFAARPLKTGDLVVAERPLLVCPSHDLLPGFSEEEHDCTECPFMNEACYSVIVSRMTDRNRSYFLALHHAPSDQYGGELGPLSGRVAANAFGSGFLIELMDENVEEVDLYSVVMKDCSRINHSCRANVVATFHSPSFSYHFRAARPIDEGEEITYPYVELETLHFARAEMLRGTYKFDCTCTSCIPQSHESDVIRTTVSARLRGLELRFPYFRLPVTDPSILDERQAIHCETTALIRDMESEGMEACETYMRVMAMALAIAIKTERDTRSGLNMDTIQANIDEKRGLLMKALNVVLAHRGEEHEYYVCMRNQVKELELGVDLD